MNVVRDCFVQHLEKIFRIASCMFFSLDCVFETSMSRTEMGKRAPLTTNATHNLNLIQRKNVIATQSSTPTVFPYCPSSLIFKGYSYILFQIEFLNDHKASFETFDDCDDHHWHDHDLIKPPGFQIKGVV